MAGALWIHGGLSLLEAIAYAGIASILLRRHVAGQMRYAHGLFIAWWVCVALMMAASAVSHFVVAAGVHEQAVVTTVRLGAFLVAAIAAACLVAFVEFLASGRWRTAPYVAGAALLAWVVVAAEVLAARPVGVDVQQASFDLVYAQPIGAAFIGAVVVIAAGPILAGAALASIARHSQDASGQRARWVGIALVVWAVSKAALVLWAGPGVWAVAVLRLIGVAAALIALRSYVEIPRLQPLAAPAEA